MSQTDDPTRKQKREAARAERQAREAELARATTRKRRLTVIGGVVALAAVVAVLLVALSSPDDDPAPVAAGGAPQASTVSLDGIPQDGRSLGDPAAPVTLVEFADLQCPFCRDFARDALPTVVQDYVRTGKVRLEFRPRTFIGDDSVKAAGVAVAAGRQDKLWNVVETLYANQGAENSGWVTDDLLRSTLRAAGADPDRAITGATSAGVARDLREADLLATRNGLESTPSFLIGKTGGTLRPLQLQALTGEAIASALDQEAAAS